MTELRTKIEDWLMKLQPNQWYNIPKSADRESFVEVVRALIALGDPYHLNTEATAVCNIISQRMYHWKEIVSLPALKWVKIKGREDYDIFVQNVKFFIDCGEELEFSKDYGRVRKINTT